MSFEEDFELSLKARPLQDQIYKDIWPIKEVNRFEHEDEQILDIRYHIDVEPARMKTFKQIHQEVSKFIESPTLTDEEINYFLNKAQDEINRYCPRCKRKFKNHHGLMIHYAKKHMPEFISLEYLDFV